MKDQSIEVPPLPNPEFPGVIVKGMKAIPRYLFTGAQMESYARAAIEPYKDEVARLQRIIDSRPAINAGLPQTYIEWSHSIYQMEAAHVLEAKQ